MVHQAILALPRAGAGSLEQGGITRLAVKRQGGLCKTKFEEMERSDGVEGAFVGV
jgi:hypothetical protein